MRVSWDDVLEWAPEVLIITPCGLNLEKSVEQAHQLVRYPGWSDFPAVREDRVYAVDANSFFARPDREWWMGPSYWLISSILNCSNGRDLQLRINCWIFERREKGHQVARLRVRGRNCVSLPKLVLAT